MSKSWEFEGDKFASRKKRKRLKKERGGARNFTYQYESELPKQELKKIGRQP